MDESDIKIFEKADVLLMPAISIDCVIIGFDGTQLKVLLLKWKGNDTWILPGGYIQKDEDIDIAAQRVAYSRTHLKDLFLTQFQIFGKVNRNRFDLDNHKEELDAFNIPEKFRDWLNHRFITIGYLSLVKIEDVNPKPDMFTDKCEWVGLDKIPELGFDHNTIVNGAIENLRRQLNYLPIGINLMPEKFTFPQLQKLYESILGYQLDRGNFQRKMLKLDFLERLEKLMEGKANKAPYLYRFNKEKYEEKLKQGIGFL